MFENNVMLLEAKEAQFKPKIVLLLLIILALFVAAYIMPQMALGKIFEHLQLSETAEDVAYLFLTSITIFAAIIYCVKIERRSFRSIGFSKKRIFKTYAVGILLGLLLLGVVIGVCLLLNAANISVNNNMTPAVILYFIGYMIQGMSEEVALRGCFMISAVNKVPIPAAVFISSLFFAIPHYLFSDGQLLFAINTLLMGVVFSVYILHSDNIWGAAGMHTGFNFFGRCLFSSYSDADCSLFSVTSNIPGKELIGGNDYGYTSGLVFTFSVLLFSILFSVGMRHNIK